MNALINQEDMITWIVKNYNFKDDYTKFFVSYHFMNRANMRRIPLGSLSYVGSKLIDHPVSVLRKDDVYVFFRLKRGKNGTFDEGFVSPVVPHLFKSNYVLATIFRLPLCHINSIMKSN